MANFIFNQGAAIMSRTGLNWETTAYDCALIDNSIPLPVQSDTWVTLAAGSTAYMPFTSRVINATGACAAASIQFTDASPTLADGRFVGFVVKRNSDNSVIAWIDTGFTNLGPSQAVAGSIMGVGARALEYTFTLRPGANTNGAWFRA